MQQDYKSDSEYLDVQVDTEYHENRMQLENLNKNLILQKAVEKFMLSRAKGLQKAFYKMRFHAKSQASYLEKDLLMLRVSEKEKELT